jgi:hypothetical protein
MDYTPLLQHYANHGRLYSEAEQEWFAHQPSLTHAIEVAALAVNSAGKRFHHQRRIRPDAIIAAKQALLAAKPRIRAAKTFHALFVAVTQILEAIPFIGELYCYDTAFRLGSFLGLLPDRVYLHAGVREGARSLGLAHTGSSLPMSALPPALRRLPAHEAEDMLCIYKDRIIRQTGCGSSAKPSCGQPPRISSHVPSGCR